MKVIPIRTLGFQLLSVLAVYSFAWAGELLFMAGEFFGVFFDVFAIVGFVILFLSCISYCLMLLAQGKKLHAKSLLITMLILLALNFSFVFPHVEGILSNARVQSVQAESR